MISLPPSFDGGCQCSVIEVAVVSLHRGTPGLPGTAAYVEGKAKREQANFDSPLNRHARDRSTKNGTERTPYTIFGTNPTIEGYLANM